MKHSIKLYLISLLLFSQSSLNAMINDEEASVQSLSLTHGHTNYWDPLYASTDEKKHQIHLGLVHRKPIYSQEALRAIQDANPFQFPLEVVDPVFISLEGRSDLFATSQDSTITFEKLRQEILRWQEERQPVYLNLSNADLYRIPGDFFEGIYNIVALDLSHNKLIRLPYSLKNLCSILIGLNASNNFLDATDTIMQLTELRYLDLSHNTFAAIFLPVRTIPHIIWIDISHNDISIMTPELEALCQQAIVNYSYNNLAEVPTRF